MGLTLISLSLRAQLAMVEVRGADLAGATMTRAVLKDAQMHRSKSQQFNSQFGRYEASKPF
jgi:uncharacterized protein YjbI with pentapeptide repeats